MKYLLTFYREAGAMENASPEELKETLQQWGEFRREAVDAGALVASEPLEEGSTAITIRVDADGAETTTDGPFTESKEQLGGFCLLEVEDREEALEWASKIPRRPSMGIEVRPVKDFSQLGGDSAQSPANATA